MTIRLPRWLLVLLPFALALALVACGNDQTAINQEQAQTAAIMTQMVNNQPPPHLDWSQPRDELIQIYLISNSARNTYTTFTSQTGQTKYACPSIGYPIPADTQLTNPHQLVHNDGSSQYGYGVVEQAEPNGLYTSANTDGTWALCQRKNGDVVPVYSELKLTAFPFEVRENPATGQYEEVETSPSSSKVAIDQTKASAAAQKAAHGAGVTLHTAPPSKP